MTTVSLPMQHNINVPNPTKVLSVDATVTLHFHIDGIGWGEETIRELLKQVIADKIMHAEFNVQVPGIKKSKLKAIEGRYSYELLASVDNIKFTSEPVVNDAVSEPINRYWSGAREDKGGHMVDEDVRFDPDPDELEQWTEYNNRRR